jgi:inorganic pyrophosphatase/exopolyphosphatase
LGNSAGDTDSIISAVVVAYCESTFRDVPTILMVFIPLEELKMQQLENKYLLETLARIENLNNLMAIDRLPPQQESSTTPTLTLVDQNPLKLSNVYWKVT